MTSIISRKRLLGWIVPLALACAIVLGVARPAGADATAIHGTLSTHLVPCATLCTSGTVTGTLSGTFDYTMATMTATPNPDIFVLTGSFVIVTATGTLTGTDTTLWNLSDGRFTDLGVFTGGSGGFAGAQGVVTIIGVFDIAAGQGQSNYDGAVITP